MAKDKQYQYDAENDPVYQAANQKVKDLEGQTPTFANTYGDQLKDYYDQVVDYKPFTYDLNGDALWQQYKDQYTTQGKLAMMDTMGQAAALTGGYGSSYSQSAGQQAYQGYLQQLNDRIPELYQLALDKYNNDYALLKDKFNATGQMRDDEYSRYLDEMGQYNTEVDRARSDADTAYERGSNAWLTGEQLRRDDENTAYSKQQDNYDRLASLISGTGYTPTQAELETAGMSAEQATAYAKVYKDSKKKSSSGSSKSTKLTIPSEIKSEIKDKSPGEISDYITKLEKNGTISSKLADYMRSVYEAYPHDTAADYKDLKQKGCTQRELDDFLLAEVEEGWITKEEANEIRHMRW